MRCSTCNAENANSFFCHACRWQLTEVSDSQPLQDAPGEVGAPLRSNNIFSALAWLELRLGSVGVWTPRGFSDRNEAEQEQVIPSDGTAGDV